MSTGGGTSHEILNFRIEYEDGIKCLTKYADKTKRE